MSSLSQTLQPRSYTVLCVYNVIVSSVHNSLLEKHKNPTHLLDVDVRLENNTFICKMCTCILQGFLLFQEYMDKEWGIKIQKSILHLCMYIYEAMCLCHVTNNVHCTRIVQTTHCVGKMNSINQMQIARPFDGIEIVIR